MNKIKFFAVIIPLFLTGCSYSGYYETKRDQHQRNAEIYNSYTQALTNAVIAATKPIDIATISYNDNGKDRTITLTTPNYAASEVVKTLIASAPTNLNGVIKSPGEDFVSGLDSFGKLVGPALMMTPLAIAATKIASYNGSSTITNTTTHDGMENNGTYKVDSSTTNTTTHDGMENNGTYKVDSSTNKTSGNTLSNMNNNPDPKVVTTEKAVIVKEPYVVDQKVVNPVVVTPLVVDPKVVTPIVIEKTTN